MPDWNEDDDDEEEVAPQQVDDTLNFLQNEITKNEDIP